MSAPGGGTGNKLTDSPTNLKEAIDWILRVTNKDGLNGKPEDHCLCPLSQAVVTVLRDVRVKEYLDHQEEKDLVKDILDSIETIGGVRTTRKLIQDVASKLADLIGYHKEGGGMGVNGIANWEYTSAYNGEATLKKLTENGTKNDDWTTLAKIFLGCIPFIFSGLSYMAWSSSGSTDRVKSPTQLLGQYMRRMGYDPSVIRDGMKDDKDHTNSTVQKDDNNPEGFTGTHLNKIIQECGILGEKELEVNGLSFAEYLEAVRSKVKEKNGAKAPKDYPLLKLNILCTGYFRALNQPYRVHQRKHRLPRTIREILYWLSCVQYCPVFRVLVQKMQQLCRMNGGPEKKIVFQGMNAKSELRTCEITPANCVSYFLSAALVAPMVLLSIQDTIQSVVGHLDRESHQSAASLTTEALTEEEKYHQRINEILKAGDNKVFIHDLYSNSLFEFRFPMSETESYYLLQDCLVALYYQLYFLKQQCNWVRGDGFEWARCKYGNGVQCDDCTTWWCSQAMEKSKNFVNGNEYAQLKQSECGTGSNKSPLQAFLTDCLPGFSCEKVKEKMKKHKDQLTKNGNYQKCYMEFLEHRGHVKDKPGQYCPIPMGFSGAFKGASGTPGVGMSGLGLNAICAHYANDDLTDSCLYQLTRCISSLTRRVPRSTGTLYGFFQGIISVYSNVSGVGSGGGATDFKDSLHKELQLATFGLPGSVTLMKAVMEWKSSGHQKDVKCECLDSLSSCSGADQGGNTCGKYLHPLTGSLYNSVATQYCDTYLSWIIHLTGVLKEGLESLQKAFRDIDCEKSGCRKADDKGVITTGAGNCDCTSKGCKPSTHGNSNNCCCHSVVHCAGVYSTFYRFGFSIHSPSGLSGRKVTGKTVDYTSDSKRTCQNFYQQLDRVITGTLFQDLLAQIRAFIYTTRLPFGLMIFGFWSIVMGYLLWSMTYNLDLMHIQSHWRSPRSYLVPLQRILADGSRNVKRVCTMKYFSDGTDDLVSQGINDLYL